MAGGAGGGRRRTTGSRGRGRGGQGRGRVGAPPRRRPPPPPPPAAAAAAADAVATGIIIESPASRTRRQIQLALQAGSNHDASSTGAGRDRRHQREGDDDSPSARTRQRLAGATHVSHAGDSGANAARLMRRLFSNPADTGTDDPIGNDDDDDNGGDDGDDLEDPYEEEEEEEPGGVANVPVAAAAGQQVQEPAHYGTNRLTAMGRDWVLEKCVKEDVFPKIKFATLDHELAFSNDPESICRFMAKEIKVEDENVERWWMVAKKAVHKKLKTNRNNVIKAIKTRFHDNILEVTKQEFSLDSIKGLRRIVSRAAYIELLDCLARAVVGRKRYMENRTTTPLSEWFTYTDEAFLLLCLESYVQKWNRAWARQQQQGQQQNEQNVTAADEEDARYTGKSKGLKRGWTDEGKERMNALLVDVARDRQANGENFDVIFKDEMIRRYTTEDTRNPGGRQHDEELAPANRVVLVYNDFNIAQLLAHAAVDTTAAGEQEEEDAVVEI